MYFDLGGGADSDSDSNSGYSSNSVVRFYLFDSNNCLNRKIFSDVPRSLRPPSTSMKKTDIERMFENEGNYASHFDNTFKSNIWVLSTKDYKEIPLPRIQHMFNRLVQEGSFANSGSIPEFLSRMKSLCQLNTIPNGTMNLLDRCKEHNYLQLHTHHVDDIHEESSFVDFGMVSLCICSCQEI